MLMQGAVQAVTEDMVIQHLRDKDQGVILLSDLLPLLTNNAGRKKILELYPDLMPKKVFKVKGLYNAKVLPRPEKGAIGPRYGDALHVLCDENVSNLHVRICQELFGYATSITFERLNAIPDSQVWDYARANAFDLIVTLDKRNTTEQDLTRIALNHWKGAAGGNLPMLLHLTGDARESGKFGKLAARTLKDIFTMQSNRDVPVARLNESGLHLDEVKRAKQAIGKQRARKILARAAMANYVPRDPKLPIPLFS